jgi:hypothetical protein
VLEPMHESIVWVVCKPMSGMWEPLVGFMHWKWVLIPKHGQGGENDIKP